jgi:hypothetical protein
MSYGLKKASFGDLDDSPTSAKSSNNNIATDEHMPGINIEPFSNDEDPSPKKLTVTFGDYEGLPEDEKRKKQVEDVQKMFSLVNRIVGLSPEQQDAFKGIKRQLNRFLSANGEESDLHAQQLGYQLKTYLDGRLTEEPEEIDNYFTQWKKEINFSFVNIPRLFFD